MIFHQMDLARFVQVYLVQGIVCASVFFLAYKILRRDTKRLNIIFSGFYICGGTGIFINFIYAPLTDESLVLILNFLTNYLICFAAIFLLVFNLVLLKSEKIMTNTKQLMIIIVYGIVLFLMILFLPFGGVTINESTDWKPVWSLPFYIYVMVVTGGMATAPNIYYSIKTYRQFEHDILKKRWKYYIIGTCGFYFITYGTFTSNTINIQEVRDAWTIISLSVVLWVYLVYFGVGRQIKH